MKKLLKTGKKALSVIMAIMMVLTAWVWVAPTEVSAATAGNYKVRITWQTNNQKKYSNQFTGTETEQGARAGIILYYKTNNGTGTEQKVYWDLGWDNNSGKGAVHGTYVSATKSTGWTDSATKKDYYCEATISGFPTAMFGMADSDNFLNTGTYTVKSLEVYSEAEQAWKTLWAGSGYTSTSTEYKRWKITADGTGANGVKTVTETGNDSKNGYASSTTENWVFPTPTTATTYTGKVDNVSVPKSGTADVMKVKVIANDQYGVQMFTPTWSISGSVCGTTGISVSPATADETTVKLTNAANVASNVDTQTGTYTATWGNAGSLSDTFTITDSYYTATFNYQTQNADMNTSSTKTEKRENYHGDTITAPTPPQYYDQDYLKTFSAWTPSFSSTITKDVTYTATYTSQFIKANYSAVDAAIAAVDAKKAEWGNAYESRFTYSSRKAIDDAINAVVRDLGRTQQTIVDGYAAAINAALAALETNKYAVIFLDNNGSILLYEKNAEYESSITPPTFPEDQKKYFDSEKHYTYTGWDTDEYTSVVDDLVILPVYEAQAHNFTKTETVTSTCTQKGATKHICECGYYYIDGETEYGSHVWPEDYKTDIQPTCTTAGQKSKYCTECGVQGEIVVIPALGHQWGSVSSLAPATCDRDGINTRLCDDCGVCEHTLVPALGHSYTKTTVAPTCTTKGYDEYTCNNCAHSYRDYNVDMLEHVYTEEILSAPACEIPGVKKLTCACGHIKTESIEALSHVIPDDFTEIIPVTCEGDGYKEKTCSKCGTVIASVVTPALTHDLETTTTPATCTTAGTTVVSCKRENCAYETTTVTQPLTHDWDNGVEKGTDCTHSAYTLYTCQRENCGETKIEVKDENAPALGHDFKGTEATITAATCTENGKKTVQCTRCDVTTEVVIPRLGHSYGNWDKTTNPATNDTDGKWTRECANCKDVEEITIPAGGHTLVKDTDNSYAATCTSKGQEAYKCNNPEHTNCSVKVTVELDYAQHTIEERIAQAATCEAPGKVEVYCSNENCGEIFSTVETPLLPHAYDEGVVTEATCTSGAYITYTCSCGEKKYEIVNNSSALGHSWSAWTVDPSTNNGTGSATRSCSRCTETESVTIPAGGHAFDPENPTSTTGAACTTGGTATYKCTEHDNCGIEITVPTSALGHDFKGKETTVENATCTKDGKKTVQCTRCEATTEVVIPKTGHTYGEGVETEATCTSGAYTTYTCTCGEKKIEFANNSAALGHDFKGTEATITAATCTENGKKTVQCTRCDVTTEVVIPRLGHSYGEWEVVKAATNTDDGEWKRVCENNASHVETITIPKGGHTWDNGTQTLAPTCTTAGTMVYKCNNTAHGNCDITLEVTIPVAQHTIDFDNKAASCTEAGYSKTYCSVCSEIFNEYAIPVKAHEYTGTEETVTEATCTQDGKKTVQCSGCNATTEVVIPKLGHKYEVTETVAPTCETKGYTKKTCATCDDVIFTDEKPALNHAWTSTTYAATCEHGAYIEHVCGNDEAHNYVEYVIGSALAAHNYVEVEGSRTDADCENNGSVEYKCSVCNDKKEEILPRLGHSYGDWDKTTNPATNDKDGTWTRKCSKCNDVEEITIPKGGHNFVEDIDAYEAPTCNTKGQRVYKCDAHENCIEAVTVELDYAQHTITQKTTAASCTVPGKVEAHCSVCDANCENPFSVTETPVIPHNYAAQTPAVAPTCTTSGYTVMACECGASYNLYDATKPATGHSYTGTVTTEATCTTVGEMTYTCACGDTYKDEIPVTDHNYTKTETAATCATPASETYSCTCGDTYTVYAGTVDKTKHDWSGWTVEKNPTNDSDGYKTRTCSACECKEIDIIPATGSHVFIDKDDQASKAPTCTEDGYDVLKCSAHDGCTATSTVPVSKLGHTATAEYTAPTCTTQGSSKAVCSTCSVTLSTVTIPVIGYHNFSGNGVVTLEANCTVAGTMTYTCLTNGCTEVKTETIPAKGHTLNTTVTDASCENTGSVVTICTSCNVFNPVTVELGAKNHAWDNGVIAEGDDATCTSEGKMTFTCSACDKTKTETIPAKGHSWSEWVKTDATVTADGAWTRSCSACSETETLSIPRGHNLVKDAVNSIAATCTTEGKEVYICNAHTDCNIKIEVTLAAKQHTVVQREIAATCELEGSVEAYCSVCNNVLSEEVIPVKAHNFIAQTPAVAPTCTTSGYTVMACECGASYNLYDATKPATGHTFVEGPSTASCTTEGVMTLTCSACTYGRTVKVPALGHSFVHKSTSQATCEKPETALYECACGESYTAVVDEKLGEHKWTSWVIVKEATDISLGYQSRTCSECDLVAYEIIESTGEHKYTIKVDEKCQAPTCTEDGLDVYGCSFHDNCTETSTVPVSKLGHDAKLEYSAATCEAEGSTKVVCNRCPAELSTETTIPALGHLYDDGTITNANCTTEGKIEYTCTRTGCTEKKTTTIARDLLAHDYITTITKPTCKSEGSIVVKCSREGCPSEPVNQKLAKIDHTWNDGETTKATCVADGKTVYTCTAADCGATKEETISKLGHEWGAWEVTKASSNTEKGILTRSCSEGCTETVEIPAGGHNLVVDTKNSQAATCSAEGRTVYICDTAHEGGVECGLTITVTLAKLQHTLDQMSVDATCLDDGEVKIYCSACDKTCANPFITTTIPATGHTYDNGSTTDATCISEGKIVYTCQNGICDDSFEITLEKLQHVYKQEGETTAPTCTTSGYTTYGCTNDECASSFIVLGAPAKGHSYTEKVSSDATCTAGGTMTLKCKDCDITMETEVPALGHKFVKQGDNSPATCEKPTTALYVCDCGESYTAVVDEKLAEHKWGTWTIIENATNTSLGYQTRTCSECGAVDYEILQATGEHKYTIKVDEKCQAPTCTEDGLDVYGCSFHDNCTATSTVPVSKLGHDAKLEYSAATCDKEGSTKVVCNRCPAELSAETTIPALGHLFDGEGAYVAATCSSEGSMTYTCERDNCDATHVTEIAENPDAHKPTTVTQPQSCKAEGSVITSCTLCQKELVKTTLPMLQHNWGSWETVQASTNADEGLMKRTCANGCTEEVAIPAGGHTLTEIARTNSTCTDHGSVTYECKVNHTGNVNCGIKVVVELPLAQHTVKTEVINASCTTEGTIKTSCSECQAKLAEDITLSKLQHNYVAGTPVDPTCTSSGYTTYACACGDSYNKIGADALGHKYTVKVSSDATCTEGGTMILKCEACEHTMTTSVPALGHNYTKISSTDATCAAAETETYKCSRCEASYTISVGSKTEDHKYPETWTVVVEASYTSIGYKTRACTVCGKLQVETIDATGEHKFETGEIVKTVPATCTENGYVERKCSVHTDCGKTAEITVLATGHEEEVIPAVAATCTAPGSSAGSKCTKCGTVTVAPVALPELGHAWGNENVTPATCKEAGKIEYTCTRTDCTAAHEVVIPVDGTAHKYTTETTQATCTTDGSVITKCSLCDDTKTTVIPATGHTFTGAETLISSATCIEDGSKTVKCANCNEVNTIILPKLGHNMVEGDKVAATCTTSGYTTYSCNNENCDHSYRVYDETVVEHNYVKVEDSSTATCLAGGTITLKCSLCGDEITAAVPALGHAYGDWTTVNPTAATEGSKTRVCSRCNTTETVILPKLGHDMVKDEDASTPATCTTEGTDVYVCTTHTEEGNICGYTYNVTVPVIAHTYDETIESNVTIVDADCENNGSKTVKCKGCNSEITSVIPRTGHTMATTVTEATCTAEGSVVTKCTADGCTYKLEDKILAVKPHTISVSYVYPGCTVDGYVKEKCDNCTYEKTISTTPKLGHSFAGEETVEIPATCLENGEKTVKCSHCNETTTVEILALGHSYEAGDEVKATCTSSGYIPYTCKNEGCTSSYKELTSDSNGHTWSDVAEDGATAATCEVDGKATYKCENCDATNVVITPKFGHSWTAWTVTKAPTATEDGEQTRTCLRGCKETVSIPALGESATHKVEFVVNGEVIFTQTVKHLGAATAPAIENKAPDAKYHYTALWDTDFSVVTSDLTVTAVFTPEAHTFGEWIIDAEADCNNAGLRHRVCDCGYVANEVIAKKEHSYTTVSETAPTCTQVGIRTLKCADCGHTTTENIKQLGHSMTYYEGYKATCDRDGLARHYNCSRCGKNFEDRTGKIELSAVVIVKKYHTYIVIEGTDATCTAVGSTDYRYCTSCGFTQYSETIPATGHADINNDNTCDKCGATYMQGGSIVCSCSCHKNGFFNELIYKILSFFWRLFGTNKACECGKVHY